MLLTTTDSGQIVQKYLNGASSGQIAEEFGVPAHKIVYILKKNNIKRRGSEKPINRIDVVQKYLNGKTMSQIAEEFNVSDTTITNILEKNHIERRKAKTIDVNTIIQKYLSGNSTWQIAAESGTTHTRVRDVLKRNNIKLRGRKESAIKQWRINTCIVCGQDFHPEISHNRITCSDKCLKKHMSKPTKPDSMHAKKDREEISEKEYQEYLAKNLGYKSWNDYANHRRHIKGTKRPLEEAKETGMYLGVYVAERVLSKIFEQVQRMPNNNIGYDFLCKKGYKIDVKCSCLTKEQGNDLWFFNIRKNTIADYFLFLAFDSRNNLEPQHIWLINSNEPVPELRWFNPKNTRLLKNITGLRIPNTPIHLKVFKRFEQTDKLKQLKECCVALRS